MNVDKNIPRYTAIGFDEDTQSAEMISDPEGAWVHVVDHFHYLHEREAAKAGVTEELAIEAGKAIAARFSEGFFDQRMVMECGRAALEAVAPMLASAQQPIPMVLHCPSCHVQHVDNRELAPVTHEDGSASLWDNPPHRSHLCHNCGTIWRPADVATVGVEKIQTEGKNDVMMPAPMASARVPDGWQLVPVEPSVEMIDAGLCGCMDNDVTVCVYKSMLAAAPKPEKE